MIQEERTDPTTLSKCLMIVSHMIENPDIIVMNPTLYSLHENLVLPCLRSEDPAVRNQAVRSLGLLCLISEELSSQHLILFMQVHMIGIIVMFYLFFYASFFSIVSSSSSIPCLLTIRISSHT